MGYNEEMAQYQADVVLYNQKIAAQASISAAAASAADALRAAGISSRANTDISNLQKGRFNTVYGQVAANDPRRDPANADQSDYYRLNPVTRDSLGLGGEAITEADRQVQANRAVASNSKRAATERLSNASGLTARGFSYKSPLLDTLNSETDMQQANANALASTGSKIAAQRANAGYALAGQGAVEEVVGGVAGAEKSRQKIINDHTALLSALI